MIVAPRTGSLVGVGETDCANAIFQQPWWLDAVAPGRWDEVTCRHEGRVVARMPYIMRGRPPLRIITQSRLTQTLGPWIEPQHAKPGRALAHEHELMAELEAGLPAARGFSQQFSPTVLNALPFHWQGYRLEVRYTYRLEDLTSVEALWEGLRGNIRREVRKARRHLDVVENLGIDRFHDVLATTYARQSIRTPHGLPELERLHAATSARDAEAMLFAVDEAQRVHAAIWVVWDRHAAYYLLGGAEPSLRTSGAGSLLMWEAILRAREHTGVFDFHGSMVQPVERFVRSFGGRQVPYLSVTRMSSGLRLALGARSGLRRLFSSSR
jgi:hypothetical protein